MLRSILRQIRLVFANRTLVWILNRIPFGILLGCVGVVFVFLLAKFDAENCNGANGGGFCDHLKQPLYKVEGFNHAIYERREQLPIGSDCNSVAVGEYQEEMLTHYRDEIKNNMVFRSIKWHRTLDQKYHKYGKMASRYVKFIVAAEQKRPLPFKLEERFTIQFDDKFEAVCKNFSNTSEQVDFFSTIKNNIMIVDMFQKVVWDELNGVPLEADAGEEIDSKPEEKNWPLVEVTWRQPLNVRSDPSFDPENPLKNQTGGFPTGAQACQVEVYEEDPRWVQVQKVKSNDSLVDSLRMHSDEDSGGWIYRDSKDERRVQEVGVCIEIDDVYYESSE